MKCPCYEKESTRSNCFQVPVNFQGKLSLPEIFITDETVPLPWWCSFFRFLYTVADLSEFFVVGLHTETLPSKVTTKLLNPSWMIPPISAFLLNRLVYQNQAWVWQSDVGSNVPSELRGTDRLIPEHLVTPHFPSHRVIVAKRISMLILSLGSRTSGWRNFCAWAGSGCLVFTPGLNSDGSFEKQMISILNFYVKKEWQRWYYPSTLG